MRKFSNFLSALRRLVEFFMFIVGFLFICAQFKEEDILVDTYKSEPFWKKNILLIGALHRKMFMMFVGFASQEACLIASGISYRPKTEKEPEEFNSLRTLQWLRFEQFISASETIGNWNIQVQSWLKYYIYMRMINRSKRSI